MLKPLSDFFRFPPKFHCSLVHSSLSVDSGFLGIIYSERARVEQPLTTHLHLVGCNEWFRCCSVAQLCLTLCNPMDYNTPGFPVFHCLLVFAQTHIHWVGDAIQPSHPLSPPSPPALSLFQHQGLFQWVGSSNQVAEVLQWVFFIDDPCTVPFLICSISVRQVTIALLMSPTSSRTHLKFYLFCKVLIKQNLFKLTTLVTSFVLSLPIQTLFCAPKGC